VLPFLYKKQSPMLGIDISSASLKLVELSQSATGEYRLETCAMVSLPPETVVDKTVKNTDVLAEHVQKLIAASGTKLRRAAVALADSSVIIKPLVMSAELNEYELETQIAFEADKHIPYSLEEVSLDFFDMGLVPNNPAQRNLLLVACRSEAVQLRIEAFKKAGITLDVVDVDSYAVERAYTFLEKKEGAKIAAVFDIGAFMTTMTVLEDDKIIFTRDEFFGGEQLVKEVQEVYDLSHEDALKGVIENTLPKDYKQKVLMPFMENIIMQIRRELQFFFSSGQHEQIDHIFLAGGDANIAGLCEMIAEQMGIPTSKANPFQTLALSPKVNPKDMEQLGPMMLLGFGLALRSFMQVK